MALFWPDVLALVDRLKEEGPGKDHFELWEKLCAAGIHDYEFKAVVKDGVLLYCFHCEHEKLCLLRRGDEEGVPRLDRHERRR